MDEFGFNNNVGDGYNELGEGVNDCGDNYVRYGVAGGDWCNSNMLNFVSCGMLDNNMRTQLMSLGFTVEEMNVYDAVLYECGKVTQQLLMRYNIPYQEAQRIKYMGDIIEGRHCVSSEDELIAHLKKMKLTNKKTGMWDLIASKEIDMKRKCLIAGMPEGTPFVLYNSGKSKKTRTVINVGGTFVEIISDVIPRLPYKDSKKLIRLTDLRKDRIKYFREIDDIPKMYKDNPSEYKIQTVAEITETDGKHIKLKIHRDYARLCGRYIIVASLRIPDNHLGMIKIITLDGVRVYVYAKQASWGDKVKYSATKERIYDYGFDVNEIQGKLLYWGGQVYSKVVGVYATNEPATVAFEHLEKYVERGVNAEVDDEYSNANSDNVAVDNSNSYSGGADDDW